MDPVLDHELRRLIREEVKGAAAELAADAVAFPDLTLAPDRPPLLNRGATERVRAMYVVMNLHRLDLELRAVDDRTLEVIPDLYGLGRGRPTRIHLAR